MTILKDTEFQADTAMTRLVLLDAVYGTWDEHETRARFSTKGVELIALRIDKKPKTFDLSHTELDALVEAWTQYKYDLQVAEQKELDRQVAVLNEAMILAAQCDGLTIIADEDSHYGRCWRIKHEWLYMDGHYATTVDYLLETVKAFKDRYDDEQATIDKAHKLAAGIEGASIESLGKGLYKLEFKGRWAHCAMASVYAYAVLERLQAVQRDLDREADKAKHDQVLIDEALLLAEKIGLSVTRKENEAYWTLNHPVYHAAHPGHLVHPDNANQLLHQVKHIASCLPDNAATASAE